MKILLTGAGGFLGKRIAHSLLAKGATDVRLHFRQRPPAGLIESLTAEFPQASITWAAANLLARGTLKPMLQDVDCVIHAAAGMRGAAADMFANTVLGSRNLLEAAVASSTRPSRCPTARCWPNRRRSRRSASTRGRTATPRRARSACSSTWRRSTASKP
jgi:nucleoside-diphosphate-sugar epimerase